MNKLRERLQKKAKNNKGFSLVELIVVIAIMAVLVGVLAPTLINNIERSRESKDLTNLDNVRQGVVTALANEQFHQGVMADTAVVGNNVTYATLAAKSYAGELNNIITSDPDMTSAVAGASGTDIYVNISSTGAVVVRAAATSAPGTALNTRQVEDSAGNPVPFESR